MVTAVSVIVLSMISMLLIYRTIHWLLLTTEFPRPAAPGNHERN